MGRRIFEDHPIDLRQRTEQLELPCEAARHAIERLREVAVLVLAVDRHVAMYAPTSHVFDRVNQQARAVGGCGGSGPYSARMRSPMPMSVTIGSVRSKESSALSATDAGCSVRTDQPAAP